MTIIRSTGAATLALLLVLGAGCGRASEPPPQGPPSRTSVLLITMDTTRADAIGPDAQGIQTPAFNAVAARGRLFTQAYATAPETLPSHSSIMTGLYPAGHGVHENGRHLGGSHPVVAERLHDAGYRTAAFVSSFVLTRRFGLARGFDLFDDQQPAGKVERTAADTTDRALAYLSRSSPQPVFMWVHYFDPHTPYAPPEPFRTRFAESPYLGEVAAMDAQIGRLVEAFEGRGAGPTAVIIAGDHGEGLGDHGEAQHGHLAYDSTMKVPLVMSGPGVAHGVHPSPVSIRRLFHTILDLAGLGRTDSLREPGAEVVLGEAMKPFLEYGWQPQVMAVEGSRKAILAGRMEVYDLANDPGEQRNLGAGASMTPALRRALEDYPVPTPGDSRSADVLDEEAKRRLASLGYISGGAAPIVRADAPRPADMVGLLDAIEKASGLFVKEHYREAVPLFHKILAEDPHNLDATLRLATAYSMLKQDAAALDTFKQAARIAPESPDVRTYLGLHYARGRQWELAVPLLERTVAESPERTAAVEALASLRAKQGRHADAIALWQKVYELRAPNAAELVRLGLTAMEIQQTPLALESLEKARTLDGAAFTHDLELGVLYLAARKPEEARTALDRVQASDPAYPMALFKRAQVSVLLNEEDRAERIALARRHADRTTRDLIANEKLFEGMTPR